jgi:NADH:ubiquinone oxidoreductase subunit C
VSAASERTADDDARALAERLHGARVVEAHGEVTLDVEPAGLLPALEAAAGEGYDFLCDVAATDHLGFGGEVAGYWGGPSGVERRDMNEVGSWGAGVVPDTLGPKRFAVSYQLLARVPLAARRLRIRVWLDDGEEVPTATGLYPCADYQEREAYDLMGIRFAGHPNLERIFLPEGWDGHPHRKDYPVGGEPVQFSDEV